MIGLLRFIILYFIHIYLITVMLSTHVHTFTFILAIVGMIGCLGRFDYNVVLALGWIILGDKNLTFTNSFGVTNFMI